MALPGNGTILAVSKEREALYARAAGAIIQLVASDLKPRDIATVEAFDNSLALDVAMGGSTNTILHTLAIAREAGIEYDIKRIDDISRRVPCICKVSPSSNYHVQDVHRAGGIHTILGELKRMGALTLSCKTVTGKTIGENIDEWDLRSEKCSPWAKTVRVSGSSAIVLDPNDKLGPAARTSSGNLAPKPMLFYPADPRAITLWRLAAAFNTGDAAAAATLFTEDAEFEVNENLTWKGPAEIQAGLNQKFSEFKGMVRAELGQLKGTPLLIIWQYKGADKKGHCLLRTGRLRQWQISKAYHEYRPAQLNEAQPSRLMPYDSAFRFDAQDCIRTKDTAYSVEGGLSILYGQLAPEGSVVKTAGISDAFKAFCGPSFAFEGPCVIFESQEEACEGILASKVKAGDIVIIRNEGP